MVFFWEEVLLSLFQVKNFLMDGIAKNMRKKGPGLDFSHTYPIYLAYINNEKDNKDKIYYKPDKDYKDQFKDNKNKYKNKNKNKKINN